MLRVGLTGNLGSGKSTVAALFAASGAHVLISDAIGRELMQRGQAVYNQIVAHFGPEVVTSGGALDRPALARIAFAEGRADELNAIVHPAVIARQGVLAAELFAEDPSAVLIVESALIFETKFAGDASSNGEWPMRFDRIILVAASEAMKIERFVRRQHPDGEPSSSERRTLQAEAMRRLALQIPDRLKQKRCDYLVTNDGSLEDLKHQIETIWPELLDAVHVQT